MKKLLKIGFRIIIIILTVVIVGYAGCSLVGIIGNRANLNLAKNLAKVEIIDQIVPFIDEETGHYTFLVDDEREFKVLQLTDTHVGGGFLSIKKDGWALNAIAALITETKPDLVIITGDMIYSSPFMSGTLNNVTPTEMLATALEQLGVYWTVAFGNHDSEYLASATRSEISDVYERDEYEHCIFTRGPSDIFGFGNQIINLKNKEGLITRSYVLLDSNSYVNDATGFLSRYDSIHNDQIEWYKNEITKLNELNKVIDANSEMLKSILFFHIPLKDYLDAWSEYVEASTDTENVKFHYGVAGEGGQVVYHGTVGDNLFETMLELGSTEAVFAGHDHLNNFSISYNGGAGDRYIRLTYGMSIDYIAYIGIWKKTAQRGGTVITVKGTESFNCYGLRLAGLEVIE
ncbi:MAG: metallophosphoesterase [Christensenellaceae bacterium]|jgi:predicted MPP superfamily phosphohydrolase|nr:metallophosphoesterase [Christensenellaceae bacterium]